MKTTTKPCGTCGLDTPDGTCPDCDPTCGTCGLLTPDGTCPDCAKESETMVYVVRNTFSPEYDVQRNWSAWIGNDWATEDEARAELAEITGQDADDLDVRYNESFGRWQHVHHEGLSCWELDAETETEAWAEAQTREYDWYGFGRCTVGAVRLIGQVNETLYLYEYDDTTSEQ